MKKLIVFCMILSLFITPTFALDDKENNENLLPNAKSGLLMEESSGEILWSKAKDEKVSVASMTKMVGQIIILEQIEKGKLNWDEKITVSKNASDMGGSQIYLETGEVMTVRDLMKGITMASANELAVSIKQSHLLKEEIII